MTRLLLLQLGCTAVLLALELVPVAQSAGAAKCYLALDAGNCSDRIQRWYFDNSTGLCQPFTYTGCGGNANNFNSTAYCYHACNVSRDTGHSYSIEDLAKKLKGNGTRQEDQQMVGDGAQTTPTDFSGQRPQLHTTVQPTLIRNPPASGSQQQQARRPVDQTASNDQENRTKRRRRAVREPRRRRKTVADLDVGYDAAPEEEFDGAHWKNVKAKRYSAGRRAAGQYSDEDVGNDYYYYGNDDRNDEVGNSFRWRSRDRRGGRVDVVSELLAQMQQTAALLERFVVSATANRRSSSTRRRPTPKNAEEDVQAPATSKAEKTARTVVDNFRQRPATDVEARAVDRSSRRPGKNTRRRGDRDRRLLHVTLLGRLERLPARIGGRRASKPEIGTAQKSQTDTSRKNANVENDGNGDELEQQVQSERRQRTEVDASHTAVNDEDHEDNTDDDIEVMSDRIRAIIADPASSFSYENISPDDMVSLEEMVSQSSQFGTMKLVEKDENEDDQEAAKKFDVTTAAMVTTPGGDSSKTKDDGDVMAKSAQQVAETA